MEHSQIAATCFSLLRNNSYKESVWVEQEFYEAPLDNLALCVYSFQDLEGSDARRDANREEVQFIVDPQAEICLDSCTPQTHPEHHFRGRSCINTTTTHTETCANSERTRRAWAQGGGLWGMVNSIWAHAAWVREPRSKSSFFTLFKYILLQTLLTTSVSHVTNALFLTHVKDRSRRWAWQWSYGHRKEVHKSVESAAPSLSDQWQLSGFTGSVLVP